MCYVDDVCLIIKANIWSFLVKIVKEYIKYYRFLVTFSLLAVLFAVEIKAMRMSESAMKYSKDLVRKERLKEEEYYTVYGSDSETGIFFLPEELQKSDLLRGFMKMSQPGMKERKISLGHSVDHIRLIRDSLGAREKFMQLIDNFSLDSLVSMANLFDFFGVPQDRKDILLKKIKKVIGSGNENIDDLKKLEDHLQKELLLVPTIDCLKDCIIKAKNMKYDQYLLKDDIAIEEFCAYALSPDSNHIVVCNYKNIILLNVENPVKSISRSFDHQMGRITAVTFSPDGKNIVFGGEIYHNSGEIDHDNCCLELWNIENLDDVRQLRVTNKHFIGSLVFSHNGKYIFSGGMSLAIWDASNLENIALKSPNPGKSIDIIHSLAISPDGNHIFSGSKRLLLWDLKDVKNITYKELIRRGDPIDSLGFSPDGKYIVLSDTKCLILWDINDSKDYVLKTCQEGDNIDSLGFTSDGKIIAYYNSEDSIANFILYDINDLENHNFKIFMKSRPLVRAVCSPDGDKIVSVTDTEKVTDRTGQKLYLSIIFTDEEMSVVNKLKEYNVDQLRLVYELCLWSLKGLAISPSREDEVKKTFKTLPKSMKKLLYGLKLFNKRQSFPKLIFKKELE